MGSVMFIVHAQMVVFSEHAQDVLLCYVHAYWVGGSEHANWRVFHVHSYWSKFWVLNRTLSHTWWRLFLPTNFLSQPAYGTTDKDPTNNLKAKLITPLKKSKREAGLKDYIYKYIIQWDVFPPKFCGLPKINQANTSLRPIVSSRGSVTYSVAKVLAKILKPLVGKSPHHVHSGKNLVVRVSKVTLQPGKCLCSYDVTALFTSVPVDPALNIIQRLLEQDTSLHNKTVLSV